MEDKLIKLGSQGVADNKIRTSAVVNKQKFLRRKVADAYFLSLSSLDFNLNSSCGRTEFRTEGAIWDGSYATQVDNF